MGDEKDDKAIAEELKRIWPEKAAVKDKPPAGKDDGKGAKKF